MVDQVEPGSGDKDGADAPAGAPKPVASEPVKAPSAASVPAAAVSNAPVVAGKAEPAGKSRSVRKAGPGKAAVAVKNVSPKRDTSKQVTAPAAVVEAPAAQTPVVTAPVIETPPVPPVVAAKAPAPRRQVTKAAAKPATPVVKPTAAVAKPAEPKPAPPKAPKPEKPAAAPLPRTATAPRKELSIMTATTEYTEKFQAAFKDASAKAKAAFEKGQGQFGELGEFTKGNVEALVESNKILAAGLQELAKGYVSESKSVFETLTAELKELAAVKSPSEFLELQSSLLRKNFDAAVAASSKNSEAVLKLANEAFQPISNRVSLAVEKVKKAA
jgi:phasin family protein